MLAGYGSRHLDAIEQWYDEGAGAERLASARLHVLIPHQSDTNNFPVCLSMESLVSEQAASR